MKPEILIKIGLVAMLLIVILLPLMASPKEKPSIKKNSLQKYDNGETKSFFAYVSMPYQGIDCTGWIGFYPSGKLMYCDLAKPIKHHGDEIPRGSRVRFYEDGAIKNVLLSRNTEIQGLPCIGYGVESPEISFWQNGKVKSAYISKSITINNLKAQNGSFSPLTYHANGTLQSIVLSRDTVFQGKTYKALTYLYFDDAGKFLKSYRHPMHKRMLYRMMDLVV